MSILNKKGEWRNRDDLTKLKRYFEQLSFFQSLKKEDDDIVYQCCKELKYRCYQEGEAICEYGEEGREFYVIIDGKVQIYTPKAVELTMTLSELYDYIQTNMRWIIWDKSNKNLLEFFTSNQGSPAFLRQGSRKFSKLLQEGLAHYVDSQSSKKYEFHVLRETVVIGAGCGFGELAVMSKKPEKRTATITGHGGPVHLAFLEKQDFQRVILTQMEKKLDIKVDFLKKFRMADGISRVNLTKLSYYFKERQFRRRDVMFKEGDMADGIYFIKEGEFEVIILIIIIASYLLDFPVASH